VFKLHAGGTFEAQVGSIAATRSPKTKEEQVRRNKSSVSSEITYLMNGSAFR